MRRVKTVQASSADASNHLAKAQQFLQEARHALEGARYDAALLGAVHAAISAADAATIAVAHVRSADPDHQRVVDLVEDVAAKAGFADTRTKQLRLLIAKKHAVEYEARRTTAREAEDSVERAGRVVEWAATILGRSS